MIFLAAFPAGTRTATCLMHGETNRIDRRAVVCRLRRRNTCQRARPDREHGGRRSLRAGWLRSFFLGAHWRDAWETPVEVPVLNLELFDGGLRPDRLSGGFETKSLHFKSGNGNVWAFRSVDKDPTRGLDPDTRDSIVGDYFRDQTSTAHPCGALVASPLLEAAGVDARAYLRARLMES